MKDKKNKARSAVRSSGVCQGLGSYLVSAVFLSLVFMLVIFAVLSFKHLRPHPCQASTLILNSIAVLPSPENGFTISVVQYQHSRDGSVVGECIALSQDPSLLIDIYVRWFTVACSSSFRVFGDRLHSHVCIHACVISFSLPPPLSQIFIKPQQVKALAIYKLGNLGYISRTHFKLEGVN